MPQIIYEQVKLDANATFLAKTSVYRSAWIVREFKKRGGVYNKQGSSDQGLRRWFMEKWVDVNRPGQPCGRAI